jgi:AraC family transcriptional activator of pobA
MKHIETISEFHQFRGLPKPQHPMISVIDIASVKRSAGDEPTTLLLDFYVIAMKKVSGAKMKYGQELFDFDEGLMSFMAPNQVFGITPGKKDEEIQQSGWVMNIHPDFLWNTSLAATIKQYDFWDYSIHEALFLSEKEEAMINHIIQNIQQEYRSNIDKFSKQIIISQIESLLSYADRFYHRQFITREKSNH